MKNLPQLSMEERVSLLEQKIKGALITKKLQELPNGIVTTDTLGVSGGVKEVDFNNEKTGINAIDPINPQDLANKRWVEASMGGSNFMEAYQVNSGLQTLFSLTTPLNFQFQFDATLGNFRIFNGDTGVLSVSFKLVINQKSEPVIDIEPDGSAGNLPISMGGSEYLTNDGLANDDQGLQGVNDQLTLDIAITKLSGSNSPNVYINLVTYRFLSRTPVGTANEAYIIDGIHTPISL